jgi:hypothetical protein
MISSGGHQSIKQGVQGGRVDEAESSDGEGGSQGRVIQIPAQKWKEAIDRAMASVCALRRFQQPTEAVWRERYELGNDTVCSLNGSIVRRRERESAYLQTMRSIQSGG